MKKIINPVKYIKFQMLLLQLEEYNLSRFFQSIYKTFGRQPVNFRKNIIWTNKLKLLSGLAFVFQLIASVLIAFTDQSFFEFTPII
ncbi:hypothetical protein ACFL1A_03345, partial [Patescibacteria group bacterium]